MRDVLNDEHIRDRSYQDWHRVGSLQRFGVSAAYAFDVDLFTVTSRDETEDGEPYQQVTMVEVNGRDFERPKKPPQIPMLTEAKCFKGEMPSPSDYTSGRTRFQLASLEALAKACGVPLYLVCYRLADETIPGIGETNSRDIAEFGTALLWPQVATAFKVYTPRDYAQRLVTNRKRLAAFNERAVNKDARGQINHLRDEMFVRWCEEFKIDHPPPWGTQAFWSKQESCWGIVADSDPVAADGKFSPRPMGSKWSRDNQSLREHATILPSPVPTEFGAASWFGAPPPTVHVETAVQPPVETRIVHSRETGGDLPPGVETRKK